MVSQFIIKNFQKSRAVKVILVDSDKRVKTRFVIPEDKTVTIGNKSFVMNPELTYYSEGFPTYIVNYENIQPLDLLNGKDSEMLPTDLNTILQSHIGRDIANASKGNKLELGLIMSAVCVVGIIYLYYKFNSDMTIVKDQLEALKLMLETSTETVLP